jgi:hypothetical protein
VEFRQKEIPYTAEQKKNGLGRLWRNSRGLLLLTIVQFVLLIDKCCRNIHICQMTGLIMVLLKYVLHIVKRV